MKRVWLWAPLGLFAVFLIVVASGLYRPDDQLHHSKMIGRPLPEFVLGHAASDRPGLARAAFTGEPRLLNIFASWCVPCVTEIPVLQKLKARGAVIEGVAIRDRRNDLDIFLAQYGNPYEAIGADPDSSIQIAIGSSGVPETFVIDAHGIIRHQHIGAITEGDMPEIIAKLAEAKSL